MEECPICSLKSVIEEEENGHQIRVCTECGAMDADFQTFASQHEGTTLTDGQGRAPSAARPSVKNSSSTASSKKGLEYGFHAIKSFGKILNFDEIMVSEACSLYERVYQDELKYSTFDSRLAMSVACLYAIGRMHHWGIAVRDVARFLDGGNTHIRFGISLKKLRNKYNVELPANSLINEAHTLLVQIPMSNEVIELTKTLLRLMERLVLTQGRASILNIAVASYFAWKALDYMKNRQITYEVYCKRFNFSITSQGKVRKLEVEKALKALVVELPWMKGYDKKKLDVAPHLQDVLKYQSSLLQGAITAATAELRRQLPEGEMDTDIEETLEGYVKHGHVFRKRRRKDFQEHLVDKRCKVNEEDEKHVVVSNKAIDSFDKVGHNNPLSPLKESNTNENVDDDVDLYIKTEEEVQNSQLLDHQYTEMK